MYKALTPDEVIKYGKQVALHEYHRKLFAMLQSWSDEKHSDWGQVVAVELAIDYEYNDEGGTDALIRHFDVEYADGAEITIGEDFDDHDDEEDDEGNSILGERSGVPAYENGFYRLPENYPDKFKLSEPPPLDYPMVYFTTNQHFFDDDSPIKVELRD